jgi:VWFA-related protein
MRQLRLGYAFVCALAFAVDVRSQEAQPAPKFRAGVELVQIDLSVLDKRRVPVGDLLPGEVTVLEDGKPRPIVLFSRVDIGGSVSRDKESSVAQVSAERLVPVNASPQQTGRRFGRVVAIMFDRSIPAGAPTVKAREIALAVVQSLGPGDEAAVVRSSRFTGDGLSQEFTSDRAMLTRAVLSLFTGQAAPGGMERSDADPIGGLVDGKPEQLFTGDCMCGTCTLDAISRVATAVSHIRDRRKLLVWIGSDMILESDAGQCRGALRDERTRLFRELDLSNLTVHVIDPLGMQTRQLGASSTVRARGVMSAQSQLRQSDLERQNRLPELPERTGGRAILNANMPSEQIPKFLAESQIFYMLGFEPSSPTPDGKFHKLEVKVARKDVHIQARRGYLASPSSR